MFLFFGFSPSSSTITTKTKSECESMTADQLGLKILPNYNIPIPNNTPVIGSIVGGQKLSEFVSISGSCKVTSEKGSGSSGTSGSSSSGGCKTVNGKTICSLSNPIKGNPTEITEIIGMAIKGVLGIVGALAMFAFVQGGFQWMTSAGSPEKIKAGRDAMMWSVIGLIATFASYSILKFMLDLIHNKI